MKKEKITNLIVHNGGYPGAHSSFACGLAFYLLKKKKPIHVIHNKALKNRLHTILFDWLYDAIAKVNCLLSFARLQYFDRHLFKTITDNLDIENLDLSSLSSLCWSIATSSFYNPLLLERISSRKGMLSLL